MLPADVRPVLATLLIAGLGIAAAATVGWQQPRADALRSLACYVALSNDLTPLVDPEARDSAAESPECGGTASRAGGVTRPQRK